MRMSSKMKKMKKQKEVIDAFVNAGIIVGFVLYFLAVLCSWNKGETFITILLAICLVLFIAVCIGIEEIKELKEKYESLRNQ